MTSRAFVCLTCHRTNDTTATGKKYCDLTCFNRRPNKQPRPKKPVDPSKLFNCLMCGRQGVRKGIEHKGKYCSMACSGLASRKVMGRHTLPDRAGYKAPKLKPNGRALQLDALNEWIALNFDIKHWAGGKMYKPKKMYIPLSDVMRLKTGTP